MNRNSTSLVLLISVLGAAFGCSAIAPGGGDDDDDAGPPPDCAADSPVIGGLVINEFMATNAATITDGEDNSFDWVELYNTTASDVSLCGWAVTRDLNVHQQFVIQHDNTVPARGHLLLWFSGGEVATDADHVGLRLPRDGGEIGLTAPSGVYSDRVVYGAQEVDFSAARARDADLEWLITWHPTPGATNSSAGPVAAMPEDPAALPEMVPAAGDLTEVILAYDAMPELELEIDADGMSKLADEPFEFVPGHIVFDGRKYGPVGIRLKGQNSFQPIDEKPSFRINIDEFVGPAKFFGLDDLTLNNMDNDFSMMHERLSYLVARQLGPASRANHALVSVNGNFYGLYANVETVKHHMIARWFDDSSGSLYEVTDADFLVDLIALFEHESGPDERDLLVSLSEALTLEPPDAAIAAASEFVNLESLWSYWAMCAVVGQFDAFPYSVPGDDYFVYVDPTTQKLSFLPWGMDETFYSSEFDISMVHSVLATKCLASPSCYQGFASRTWEAQDLVEQMDLAGERTRVIDQIAPYVAMDQRKPYDDAMVAEFQTQLRYFIENRRQKLSDMLPPQSGP